MSDDQKIFDPANPGAILDGSEAEIRAALDATEPKPETGVIEALIAAEDGGKTRKGVSAYLAELRDAPARAEAERVAADEVARVTEPAATEAPGDLLAFGLTGPVGEGANAAAAVRDGLVAIVFGDGDGEIGGLRRVHAVAEDFDIVGARALYRRPIAIAGADVNATIQSVALVDASGAIVAVTEVPGGLPLAGRNAELPGGSLIFG